MSWRDASSWKLFVSHETIVDSLPFTSLLDRSPPHSAVVYALIKVLLLKLNPVVVTVLGGVVYIYVHL